VVSLRLKLNIDFDGANDIVFASLSAHITYFQIPICLVILLYINLVTQSKMDMPGCNALSE
jgi:hypothetical protein